MESRGSLCKSKHPHFLPVENSSEILNPNWGFLSPAASSVCKTCGHRSGPSWVLLFCLALWSVTQADASCEFTAILLFLVTLLLWIFFLIIISVLLLQQSFFYSNNKLAVNNYFSEYLLLWCVCMRACVRVCVCVSACLCLFKIDHEADVFHLMLLLSHFFLDSVISPLLRAVNKPVQKAWLPALPTSSSLTCKFAWPLDGYSSQKRWKRTSWIFLMAALRPVYYLFITIGETHEPVSRQCNDTTL